MPDMKREITADASSTNPGTLLDDALPTAYDNVVDGLDFSEVPFRGHHFSKAMRLHRLFRHGSRLFAVPLDHSVTDGPIVPHGRKMDQLVADLASGGVDAVVMHKGTLRRVRHTRFEAMSLIIHLSAGSSHAADPDAKYLVTGVEEALTLGADAVSIHVNLGSLDERRQIADLGAVAGACDRWNLPLLAMVYPRGPRITDPPGPELVAHAAILAADLGADLVKTVYPGSAADMADVASACPIPVLVAGGSKAESADQVLESVESALLGGAGGVAIGRNVFMAPDPRAMARRVSSLVRQFADTQPGASREGR
jgi:2-amino-4,5-dihydroxy-6-oxo-7-(phosphonooxy)heptanoate synthase